MEYIKPLLRKDPINKVTRAVIEQEHHFRLEKRTGLLYAAAVSKEADFYKPRMKISYIFCGQIIYQLLTFLMRAQ